MDNTDADEQLHIETILREFDLGELVSLERNTRGTVNTNYVVDTDKDGVRKKYFLRRYKNSIKPEEIDFEHSIIRGLIEQGVDFVARVYPTVSNRTYLTWQGSENQSPVYYAVFDYLSGEDKYTWVDPRCTRKEYCSAAQILARFHEASASLTPAGSRGEAEICELIPLIADQVSRFNTLVKNTAIDRFLRENADLIIQEIRKLELALSELASLDLPKLIIHCDFHPGNLKFFKERVVGLLDFDWSKIDLRAFDVALALWYFFTNWRSPQAGWLRLDEVKEFLTVYQITLADGVVLEPLNKDELESLPILLRAANLYVFNWAIGDCYSKNVDPEEYLGYLKHNMYSLRWLQNADFSPAIM